MRFALTIQGFIVSVGMVSLMGACGGSDDDGGSRVDAGDGNGAEGGVTYVSEMRVPSISGGVPTCCKDFGELSKPYIEDERDAIDNAFAQLGSALSTFGFDMQAAMTASVEEGQVVVLFDHTDLTGENDTFRLDGYFGAFAGGTSYAEASAGQGSFAIEPHSFDGAGNPLIRFDNASMDGGSLLAGPAVVGVSFPVTGGALDLQLHAAEVTGDATISSNGVTYANGTIAGYLLLENIFGAANDFLNSDGCACLNLGGRDIFVQVDEEWDAECLTSAEQDAQTCDEDSGCLTLASGLLCGGLPTILESEADIRTDAGSSVYQGLSVGWSFSGVPAEIVD